MPGFEAVITGTTPSLGPNHMYFTVAPALVAAASLAANGIPLAAIGTNTTTVSSGIIITLHLKYTGHKKD